MTTPSEHDTGLKPADLDADRPRPVETPWGTLALYVVDGVPRAFEAFCPHMEGPLFAGSIADGIVTCPWHGWRYSLADGRRVDAEGPADGPGARALVRAEVRVSAAGTLVLRAPDLDV